MVERVKGRWRRAHPGSSVNSPDDVFIYRVSLMDRKRERPWGTNRRPRPHFPLLEGPWKRGKGTPVQHQVPPLSFRRRDSRVRKVSEIIEGGVGRRGSKNKTKQNKQIRFPPPSTITNSSPQYLYCRFSQNDETLFRIPFTDWS